MANEDDISWIMPGEPERADESEFRVFRLGHWRGRPDDLLARIKAIVSGTVAGAIIPVVVVLDDVAAEAASDPIGNDPARLAFLTSVAEAGGHVLEPESQDEVLEIRADPRQFVLRPLAAVRQTGPVLATSPQSPLPVPSDPTGYEQFGQAVTRLTPSEMESLIHGRHSDV